MIKSWFCRFNFWFKALPHFVFVFERLYYYHRSMFYALTHWLLLLLKLPNGLFKNDLCSNFGSFRSTSTSSCSKQILYFKILLLWFGLVRIKWGTSFFNGLNRILLVQIQIGRMSKIVVFFSFFCILSFFLDICVLYALIWL